MQSITTRLNLNTSMMPMSSSFCCGRFVAERQFSSEGGNLRGALGNWIHTLCQVSMQVCAPLGVAGHIHGYLDGNKELNGIIDSRSPSGSILNCEGLALRKGQHDDRKRSHFEAGICQRQRGGDGGASTRQAAGSSGNQEEQKPSQYSMDHVG